MRSFAYGSFAVAVLLGLALVCPSTAAADRLVKFAAASSLPHALGDGARLPPSGPDIRGYLTKPKGDGPFPAVVLLHSCLGLRADRGAIASTLAGWGYASLFVDDFGTRGIRETCAVDFPEGLSDAFGALAFIGGLPYVDRTRIVAVGYSQGADTALRIAASGRAAAFAIPDGLRFKAAAAFYPPCENQAGVRLWLPTLILVGAADTVTPAAACEQLASAQPGTDVKVVVYPGAGHVFDDPAFKGGKQLLGMWLAFDQSAAEKSKSALRSFLAAELGR